MPPQDRLEIIKPNGEVEFYPLAQEKGVTNIGRHPENDIVLSSPGVAPFHAVLDHRQKPYQLVVLSHEGTTTLGDRILPPNVAAPLRNWDPIQFDGHVLVFIEGEQAGLVTGAAAAPVAPVPSRLPEQLLPRMPAAFPPPSTRPERPALASGPPQHFTTVPPDQTDENILLELSEARDQTVDVGQTASYQLTIINGGSIVATFMVGVAGLDESWIIVSPPQVNLFEGERTSVTINITPPRQANSRAGIHPFAIVVSSPNYPGQRSQRGTTLSINPYYDFAVSELTPKRQTMSWFQRAGQAYLSITNKGNGEAPFRIAGEDDERAASFEFNIPGEAVGLARQADLTVPSEEMVSIPVTITPYSRRLVALRKRTYAFTITTTLLEGQQTPRSVLGELKHAPLIGPLLIFLIVFLIVASIFLFFWPDIRSFNVNPGSITAGQDVTLAWNAFPPFFVNLRLNNEPVEAPRGNLSEKLHRTTTYEMTAETWLSRLFPLLGEQETRIVEVTPVRPDISLFKAEPEVVTSGEPVILSWFVIGADELTLTNNSAGTTDTLADPAGSRIIALEQNTAYTLRAVNESGPDAPVEKLVNIRVTTPTPVPIPRPVIQSFIVQPQVISAGQTVTLQWAVTGANSVSVQPLGAGLPPISPPITHAPQETTLYVLSASNGEETVNAVQQVTVGEPPTPTPSPTPGAAPSIEFFAITPEEHIRLDNERDDKDNEITVQLNWVVTGDTTNVEITGGPPGFEKISNLSRIGELSLDILDTTVFVLTAYNGPDTKAVKTTQIKFLDPTPVPTPTTAAAAGGGDGSGGSGGSDSSTLPEITSFTAQGVSPPRDQVSCSGNTCQVVAGSNVNVIWNTQNADTVTLVGVGSQPPAGTFTVSNVVANKVFQLTATNSDGSTERFLQLVVIPKPAPPPPTNVNGSQPTGTDIILTWDYSAENDIVGFRVYRATATSGPFSRVADESQLSNSARQYVDRAPLPACTGYYVTAVYIDPPSGNKMETPASTNSWFSAGCP